MGETRQSALDNQRAEERGQEDARRQVALLQRTSEIAGIGGWELAIPSLELTWSPQVYRIHEVDPARRPTVAEAINFYALESRPIIEAAVRQAIENGTPFSLELAFITATGRRRWVRSKGEAERAGGQIVRLMGSFQDITEHQEAVESLRRSETRFRTLYNATSDAVMVLDEQRFLDCNPTTLAIFGCANREEFCAKHPADVSPPQQPCGTDSRTLARQRIATALKLGSHQFEWLHCRADTGEPFPAEVWFSAMQLDGRKVLQAVVRDISERKRLEVAERQRSERLLQFQTTLLDLRSHEGGKLADFFQFATEQISGTLGVERVSIWFFDETREALVCHDLFQQSRATHESGQRLVAANFPSYFKAFTQEAAVLADEACTHPTTREFAEVYLKPNGITSMLDAPFRLGSEIAGVLCCEHTGLRRAGADPPPLPRPPEAPSCPAHPPGSGPAEAGPGRHWTPDEEKFALAAAATILQVRDHERRRLAEAALKESETRLRNLAEAATEGIFFHEHGIISDANPESCRMFGYRLEELVGRSGLVLLPPELHEPLRPNLSSRENLRYETLGLRRDGSRFPVELSARNTIFQGRPVRVVCVRDLTAAREAADQLRENEARLRRVMEGSEQGFWERNVLTNEVSFSDRWFTMLEYQPSELEPKYETWLDLLHPDDKPAALAASKAHVEGRAEQYEAEYRMRTKSGQWRWILSHGHVVRRDPAGQAIYLAGTHTDITARREAEAWLRDREALLSSINSNLLGSVIFRYQLAPAGWMTCTYVTPNVELFLGAAPAEVIANPEKLFARVLPEDLPLIKPVMQRALATGEDTSLTIRIVHPHGGIRWLHFRGRMVERRADGTQVRDGIATDITAIKEVEAKMLRQAEFLDALHQTTLDLLNRLEQRDLMQAVVERAAALFAAPFCELILKENEELVVVACTRDQPFTAGSRLRREEAPLSWQALDTAKPVVVTNYSLHPDRCQKWDPLALQAVAELPIVRGNACLGVLSLGRTEPGRPFSAEEVQRGEILAKNAALVIYHAGLYAEAVREAEQRTIQLRESEELYRSLVETSPVAIIVADFQGQVLKVNIRALEIFGNENNPPIVGRSMFDWVAPAEISRLQSELPRLRQAGEVRGVAAVLLRQGDRPFEALMDGVIIRNTAGQPQSMMLQIQDVTERRRAERALAESEEKYRGLVTSVNDGVFVMDTQGKLLFANPALARLGGFEQPEQVVGRKFLEFIAPEKVREIAEAFQRAVETGRTRDAITVEIVRRDGSVAVAEIKSIPVREGGQIVAMNGTIRDITQHKRAEQALQSAHRRTLVLAQLGRELAEAATPRLAALSILQAALQLFNWDCGWLHLWDEDKNQLLNLATFDIVDGEHRDVAAEVDPRREVSPLLQRVIQEGAQLLLRENDTDHISELQVIGSQRRSLSLMFAPIRVADRLVGILSAQSYRPQAYDQAALELLQTLADHCAGALARIQATSALAVSEERFRRVWENATDGMRLTDAEGRIVAANEAFCRMMGKARNAIEGQLLSVLYAESENQKILARHRARFARRDVLTRLEIQLTLADGRTLWIEVSNCFIETDPARPLLLGIFRDITERKLTEDALRLLPSGLANLAGEAFFQGVACQLTRLLGVEIAFICKLLGGEPARVRTLGLCVDGLQQPALEYDLAGTACAEVVGKHVAVYPDHVAEQFPADPLLKDLRVSSYAVIPLWDPAGHALGQVGVMSRQPLLNPHRVEAVLQLFAVRVAAEIERQRAERRFHDLFVFSPDAIVMSNQEGRIVMANPQAEKLFGYAPGELIGHGIEDLLPAANRAGHVELREKFHRAAVPRSMAPGLLDLRGLKKDGTEFPADISLSPLESDTGTWVVAAIRDLTELRRAQQQTLRAQRLESIGRLAGGVAHDLNNALAPIVIATEMLYERYPDSTELLDTVSASAKRAADMVKQLLTYARGVEGARRLIQPQHLLKDMEKIIKSTFPKDIELRIAYAPNLQPILGDATQLQQVLLNLCVNARDVMPRGGTLTLAAENVDLDAAAASVIPEAKPGRYVVWRVTDTGPGIPPGIVDRIFEPFFSTKGPAQGTGLGLSTAVGIVKSHGGFIRVSSPPGQGATFEVFLPGSDASAASPVPASKTS